MRRAMRHLWTSQFRVRRSVRFGHALTSFKGSQTNPRPDENGVVAIIVAVSATVIFGVGALVLDVGAARQERRELQNGADAAALALAQFCARGDCTDLVNRATTYAGLNAKDGQSRAAPSLLSGNRVHVVTRTSDAGPNTDGNANTVDFVFAPVLGGPNGAEVTAIATAVWGSPSGGTGFPLTFSKCEWNVLTSSGTYPTTTKIIYFHDPTSGNGNGNGAPGATECTAQAGQDTDGDSKLNGGFGWMAQSGCVSTVNALGWVSSSPGAAAPNSCSPSALLNADVRMPIFDDVIDNNEPGWANQCGTNKCYHIWGIATFHINGFQLAGNGNQWIQNAPAGCSPARRCVEGYFKEVVVGWTGGALGGPDTHTYSVYLTE